MGHAMTHICGCLNKTSNYVFSDDFLLVIHYVSAGRGPGYPKPHNPRMRTAAGLHHIGDC